MRGGQGSALADDGEDPSTMSPIAMFSGRSTERDRTAHDA